MPQTRSLAVVSGFRRSAPRSDAFWLPYLDDFGTAIIEQLRVA